MDNSLGKKFVDLIFKNGQIVALFFVFLVVGAAIAFGTSHAKGFPDVKINIAFVTIPYPGATATQVEDQVIKPIETTVSGIKNVTEYSSTSADSFGSVVVTFDDKANYEDSVRDLSSKLARVQLPAGAKQPEIADISAGGGFDFLVGVTGPNDARELYNKANFVKSQIESIKGVSKVEITDPLKPTIQVTFDNAKLLSHRLTRAQVEGVLKLAQLDFPVGQITDVASNKVNIGVTKMIDGLSTFGDLLVAPNTKLSDVASVDFVMDDQGKYNRIGYVIDDRDKPTTDGTLAVSRGLILSISLKDGVDILKMDNTLADKYADLTTRVELGGNTKIATLYSQADSTRDQVNEIKAGLFGKYIKQWGGAGFIGYLLGGIVLVILLLLIFINWRVALLASLSIPLALGVSMLYLKLLGVEINTLVLFSMVLVIGLVVDPTIVFLEALHRYRRQGFAPIAAATKTINSVGFGVAVSAIANFVVFAPFGVVGGFFGQIIRYIPITVIPAIIASFLVPAIFFLPVAANWLKLGHHQEVGEEQELVGAWVFSKWLGRVVKGILAPGRAWLRALIIFLAVVAPIAVSGAMVSSGAIKFVQFSAQEDSTIVMVNGTIPSEWTFSRAATFAAPLQSYLAKQPEIKDFVYYQQNGNSFTILATLWPIEERQSADLRTSTKLAKDLNTYFASIHEIKLEASVDSNGPPSEAFPVKIRVFDSDVAKLQGAAEDIKAYLASKSDVIDIEDSLTSGSTAVTGTSLVLDAKNPSTLNPMLVAGAIKDRLDKTEVGSYEIGGDTWTLTTQMLDVPNSVDGVKGIGLLPGLNVGGLVSNTETETAKTIQRLNGQRYVEVRAKVKDGVDPNPIQLDLNKYLSKDKLESLGLADDAAESKGAADSIATSFTQLLVALAIALFVIYVLLVGFFRSLIAPLIIMFAIPLGLVGVFPAIAAATGQLGFLELLGVVAMAGIVVNVTILIIDFANQLMARGMTAQEAISTSIAVRYKAIFLTKVSISAGLLPLAIFSPFWRGLALAMIFGIIASAILSMFTTPIFYVWTKGRGKAQKVNDNLGLASSGDGWSEGESRAVPHQEPDEVSIAGNVNEVAAELAGDSHDGPTEDEIRELLVRIIEDHNK